MFMNNPRPCRWGLWDRFISCPSLKEAPVSPQLKNAIKEAVQLLPSMFGESLQVWLFLQEVRNYLRVKAWLLRSVLLLRCGFSLSDRTRDIYITNTHREREEPCFSFCCFIFNVEKTNQKQHQHSLSLTHSHTHRTSCQAEMWLFPTVKSTDHWLEPSGINKTKCNKCIINV